MKETDQLKKLMESFDAYQPVSEEVAEGAFKLKAVRTADGPELTIYQSGHPIAVMDDLDFEELMMQYVKAKKDFY